jgi:hypothetical protein
VCANCPMVDPHSFMGTSSIAIGRQTTCRSRAPSRTCSALVDAFLSVRVPASWVGLDPATVLLGTRLLRKLPAGPESPASLLRCCYARPIFSSAPGGFLLDSAAVALPDLVTGPVFKFSSAPKIDEEPPSET